VSPLAAVASGATVVETDLAGTIVIGDVVRVRETIGGIAAADADIGPAGAGRYGTGDCVA
jgi:hypothetical protein